MGMNESTYLRIDAAHYKRSSMPGRSFFRLPQQIPTGSTRWRVVASLATRDCLHGSHSFELFAVHLSVAVLYSCIASRTEHSALSHSGCFSMICGCGCSTHISFCFTPSPRHV